MCLEKSSITLFKILKITTPPSPSLKNAESEYTNNGLTVENKMSLTSLKILLMFSSFIITLVEVAYRTTTGL